MNGKTERFKLIIPVDMPGIIPARITINSSSRFGSLRVQCCNFSLSSKKGTLHIKVCDYGEKIIWWDIFLPWYMTCPQIHLKKWLKFSQNYQTKLRALYTSKLRALYTLECWNSNFLVTFCNMAHNSERIFQYFSTKFSSFIPKV